MSNAERTLVVRTMGVDWRLVFEGLPSEGEARLRVLWERCALSGAAPEARDYPISQAGDLVKLGSGATVWWDPEFYYRFSGALTVASLSRRVGTCMLYHAAGLAADDGGTVAFVAESGTGKTTAARVLGRRHGYVSDETIAVNGDLTIDPYPKPLSSLRSGERKHGKEEASPDELGMRPTPEAPWLRAVVVLDRSPENDEPVLEQAPLCEAMYLVVPQTSSIQQSPGGVETLARQLSLNGGPYRLRYSEISDCESLLDDLISGRLDGRDPAPPWDFVPGTGPDYPHRPAEPFDEHARYERSPHEGLIASEGLGFVLLSGAGHILPDLALALWLAMEPSLCLDEGVDLAVAQFGEHPSARALVMGALSTLASAEIIQRVP